MARLTHVSRDSLCTLLRSDDASGFGAGTKVLSADGQIEAYVETWRGVGQCADRDEVYTRLSDGADSLERDSARGLENGPAGCQFDRLAHCRDVHVIEHDDICAGIERKLQLFERRHLDFDADRVRSGGPGCGDDRWNSFGTAHGGNMVVLDQHAVEQSEAMIRAAAVANGRLLQDAHTGSRFAGIDYRRRGTDDGFDIDTRQTRHARKSLDEIERRSFCGQH